MGFQLIKTKLAKIKMGRQKNKIIKGAVARICQHIREMILHNQLYCKVSLRNNEVEYISEILAILQKHGYYARVINCLTLLICKDNCGCNAERRKA